MEEETNKIQSCRFYPNEYPQEEDLVVVEVVNVEDNASYVSLLEYNKIEGMITPNEYTKQMKQSIHKALRLGKQEVVRVLRVDTEKGYIDLSKLKVPKQEELQCKDKFAKSKQCNAMLIGISEKAKTSLEKLYQTIIWPLYKTYNHPIEAFQQCLHSPEILDKLDITSEVKELLLAEIRRRLQPQTIKVKAEFELSCATYEGVEAIKKALKAGEKCGVPKAQIKFYIVGSPVYSGDVTTQDKNLGIKVLKDALVVLEEEINKLGGKYKLRYEPKICGQKGQDDIIEEVKDDDTASEISDESGMGDADDSDYE